MDINNYYVVKEGIKIDDLNIIKSDNVIYEALLKFVQANAHIQELEYLFQIYQYNFTLLHGKFTLKVDDSIQKKDSIDIENYVAINALVINLISAAKILTDSIQVFYKKYSSEEEFQKINRFDESFSYRLCYFLRNYSQHGHLPVSCPDGTHYCFELKRILNTQDFSIKKTTKEEFTNITDEIYEKYKDSPKIGFVITLVEYDYIINEIYNDFLLKIKSCYYNIIDSIETFVQNYPHYLCEHGSAPPFFKKYLCYMTDDSDELHTVDWSNDLKGQFQRIIDKSSSILDIRLKNKNLFYKK